MTNKKSKRKSNSSTAMPAIIIDTREQAPYTFNRATSRALITGDYSLDGFETRITVERKSKADLFGSVGKGRARFEKEFQRMAGFDYAALIVECSVDDLKNRPPAFSQLSGAIVFKTLISWSIRYGVHVFFAGNREYGRAVTYEILRKFWRADDGRIKADEKKRNMET